MFSTEKGCAPMARMTLCLAILAALATPTAAQTGRVYGSLTDPTGDSVEWSPMLELGMIQETITITTDPADAPAPRARTVNVAPPPPPPAPAPAGVVRVGGNIKPPQKVVHVSPVYPADAAAQ